MVYIGNFYGRLPFERDFLKGPLRVSDVKPLIAPSAPA